MGFISKSELARTRKPPSRIAQCGICGLFRHCLTPKMEVSGEGRKGILVVAEAPGADEDRRGTQLVGKAGQRLRRELRSMGIDLDEDCWKTNALICRPPNNKTPTDKEIDYCRPNLHKTLRDTKPRVIIPMGLPAIKAVLGGGNAIWKEKDLGSMSRWAGWQIPCRKPNVWICPTWHPSYLERMEHKALDLWFRRHLSAAVGLQGRPWRQKPSDPADAVESILRPSEAAAIIRDWEKQGGLAAFDYECDRLKPEAADAQIVSCSVCWEGKRTIAFPWRAEVRDAMSRFLKSPNVRKIASNMKFEERWTRAKLGHRVRRWDWDSMLAAHWLDNRREITGLKFQAFVLMGVSAYDEHLEALLKAPHARAKNRIHEISMKDLLLYNGLDSLLEYEVAQIQKEKGHVRVAS